METFIAYRLPHENAPRLLKGEAHLLDTVSSELSNGILLHSFLGDQIVFIKNPEEINREEFEIKTHTAPLDTSSRADYFARFSRLKTEIASGRFKKVILSRTKISDTKKTALDVFDTLNATYPNTFNYVISNATIGTWIGATPERLLTVNETYVETMSLAGTKTTSDKWSSKELEEQQLVTDTILKNLESSHCTSIQSKGPVTIKAGAVEHLKTTISAELSSVSDWANVVKTLHPTPAVCGIPTHDAKSFIPELEGYNRHFYTGFIGILTARQKYFFVNLRCMEFFGDKVKLYIGGGITAPSNAEAEWNETERKSKTLLTVLR